MEFCGAMIFSRREGAGEILPPFDWGGVACFYSLLYTQLNLNRKVNLECCPVQSANHKLCNLVELWGDMISKHIFHVFLSYRTVHALIF